MLALSPRLLVLDEPTTGLDSRVETEIMKLIDGLRAQLGFASILISHNLPLVAAHCQRIGVLRGGDLVEEGPAADVLLAPRHPCTRALIAALPGLTAARRPAPRAVAVREHAAAVRIQDQDDPERRRLPPAPPGPRSAGADEPLVTVAHLTKRYHRQAALRDVSFTIGRGEVLGLVGESGSGKSTLGLALAGLTCYEGTISFGLPPGAGPSAREGTDPRRGRGISSQARLLDLLAELQDRTGVSYLFISHDLAVVRQVSDRIGVLHDGELVELKTADAIFTEPGHWYTRSLVDSALRTPHLGWPSCRRTVSSAG